MIRPNGQATRRSFVSADPWLGICRVAGNVLDVALKVMIRSCAVEDVVLSDKMKREADRLIQQIGHAESSIVAAERGARAEGFVLGLETAGALRAGDAENLYVMFAAAVEERLKALAGVTARPLP